MAKILNISGTELDRRPTKMEINWDAPHVRIFIETGITVFGQRHTSQDVINLNGDAAGKFIKMLCIDTNAFEDFIVQDIPTKDTTITDKHEDYLTASQEVGHRVEEQKVTDARRKKK